MNLLKSNIKIGDKVQCVDAKGSSFLTLNQIYTIRSIEKFNNIHFITLKNLPHEYFSKRFKILNNPYE